jgi:hypothetical protein
MIKINELCTPFTIMVDSAEVALDMMEDLTETETYANLVKEFDEETFQHMSSRWESACKMRKWLMEK